MIPICTLGILFFHAITGSRHPHLKEGDTHIPSRYLWNKLHFGTQWKVYIQVMTYDLLHSSFYGRKLNDKSFKTLLDVARNLPVVAAYRHPCRRGLFVAFGRQFEGKFFSQGITLSTYYFATAFRICGRYSFTFNPGHFIDEPNLDLTGGNIYPVVGNLKYAWHLQAGTGYGVNCTVSEFTAPRSHGCGDTRVKTKLFFLNDVVRFVLCPNGAKHNFVAIHIEIMFLLLYYQIPFSINKGQQYSKLSFEYQILDHRHQSFKLYMAPIIPTRERVELGVEYTFGAHNAIRSLNDSPLVFVGKSPTAVVYVFGLYLGDNLTPVISRSNVACTIPEAEILFYDGPLELVLQAVVPILKYWKCSNTSDNTIDNIVSDEVQASLGELNIFVIMSVAETPESLYLAITWHAEPMLQNVLKTRRIHLNMSTVSTIHFEGTRTTLVDVVNVQAPEGKFVHLGFSEITYILHAEIYANTYVRYCVDGFEIKDPMQFYSQGQVCSNSTAENLFKHYQLEGLTVGPDIILKRKQYAWLGTISAVVIASVHSCAGYINVLPSGHTMFSTYEKPGAIVTFDARHSHFKNGTFVEYMDMRVRFTRSTNSCCKLQIVPFENLGYYVMGIKKVEHLFIKYMITSEDLTSPARFVMDLSSAGTMLVFRNTSSSYGIRLYSLNARIVNTKMPYTEAWETEAYSAQIALHPSILTRAAGFKLQVEDGTKPPVCTDEGGGNVTDMFFDMLLLGPCAKAKMSTKQLDIVQIYKIYEHSRCCNFDGYINIDQFMQGRILQFLYSPGEKLEPWIGNLWNLSESYTVIKFHVLCNTPCSTIFFQMNWDRNFLNTVTIVYRANLLDQTNVFTGITFPQSQIDVSNPLPQMIFWNRICYSDHCYSTPKSYMATTWGEAQGMRKTERFSG